MKIAIAGTGYVGLLNGLLLASKNADATASAAEIDHSPLWSNTL